MAMNLWARQRDAEDTTRSSTRLLAYTLINLYTCGGTSPLQSVISVRPFSWSASRHGSRARHLVARPVYPFVI
jgi:hypothetical protein